MAFFRKLLPPLGLRCAAGINNSQIDVCECKNIYFSLMVCDYWGWVWGLRQGPRLKELHLDTCSQGPGNLTGALKIFLWKLHISSTNISLAKASQRTTLILKGNRKIKSCHISIRKTWIFVNSPNKYHREIICIIQKAVVTIVTERRQ